MAGDARDGPYETYYSDEERRALKVAAERSGLDAEIGAARVALIRMLASPAADERPELLLRAVESIVRAIRVKHQIGDGAAENVLEVEDRVLHEKGLGERGRV